MKRLFTLILAAALMLCLFAGCKGDDNVSPSPDPDPTPTETSPPTDPPTPTAEPDITTAPPPEPTPPPVTWEPIDFPELTGFEKMVNEQQDQVSYGHEEGYMTVVMTYVLATPTQIEQARTGRGPELEEILTQVFALGSSILSEKVIDLPGLSRKGLEMELDVVEGIYGLGLVIPSEGQVITLLGVALEENEQDLKDAYGELVRQLTV